MLRKLIRTLGYDVVRFPYRYSTTKQEIVVTSIYRENRFKLIQSANIDLIIDIGANEGQYGKDLRANGFTGKIISFEPLNDAFAKLKQAAKNDTLWETWKWEMFISIQHHTPHLLVSKKLRSKCLMNSPRCSKDTRIFMLS
jgi:hypothetical protein